MGIRNRNDGVGDNMKNLLKKILSFPIILFHLYYRVISDYIGSLEVKKYSHSSKIIRTFKDDDLIRVLELYEEGFGNKNSTQIVKYSKLFRNVFYVYEIDGEIVGYLGFYVHQKFRVMKIIQIATAFSGSVDSRIRGQGIFTTLYSESLSELKRNNVQAVYGFIDVNNYHSLSIHNKLGYKIIQQVRGICDAANCYKVELVFDR